MSNCILVLSGGQDSTTCAFWAKQIKKYDINAITINYGQRHQREIKAAQDIAKLVGVNSHETIEVGPILKSTSPLVSSSELEQYKDHQSLPGGIEKTFVPMRNQLFATIAFNRAVLHESDSVIMGVCEEDYGGYPDCREDFISVINQASNLALYGVDKHSGEMDGWIELDTPLMHLTKADSIELALRLEGCYEALAYTHTSYDGAFPPTGHDHATLLRAKGFEEAHVPDPLVLRCNWKGLMDIPDTWNYSSVLINHYMTRLLPYFEQHETD